MAGAGLAAQNRRANCCRDGAGASSKPARTPPATFRTSLTSWRRPLVTSCIVKDWPNSCYSLSERKTMARILTKEQSDGANPLSDAAEAEDAKAGAETTAGQSGDTQ